MHNNYFCLKIYTYNVEDYEDEEDNDDNVVNNVRMMKKQKHAIFTGSVWLVSLD